MFAVLVKFSSRQPAELFFPVEEDDFARTVFQAIPMIGLQCVALPVEKQADRLVPILMEAFLPGIDEGGFSCTVSPSQ